MHPPHHDAELVSTETRHEIALGDRLPEAIARMDEELVAGAMTERVIDLLEPVEVDQEHRDRLLGLLRAQPCLDLLCELDAVRKPGEVIVG